MPLYVYDCSDCKASINIRHAYGVKDVRCVECESLNIKKNLSGVLQLTKKCYNIKDKVGNEVNKAIKDGKKELDSFKKKRKNRVYKDK
tara:strand:+ start:15825 stop:16088 length:264 start_codon:yes stop_codon:yes gene_type:complete